MRPLRSSWVPFLLLALWACGSPVHRTASGGAPGRLDRILSIGELRVGTSADQPPLNLRDRRGEIAGFDADIARALAHAMGLELRFVVKPFAELLPALERGEVDAVISGVTMTPERNARVAFAGPYFVSGMSILARAAALPDAERLASLDDPQRRYAAVAGTTSESFATGSLPRAKLVLTPDSDTAVQMVIDGRVDAMLADHLICSLAVWRHPDAGLATLATPFTVEPLGIALPADAPLFLNLVENYLKTLETTGLLAQLKARWLADGSWMSELP